LREHNNFRVFSDDVVKKVQNHPIHRDSFDYCFKEDDIKTVRLAVKDFGLRSCVRDNQHKDMSMVAPFCYITFDLEGLNLRRGDLVLPLCVTSLFNDDEVPVFQVFVTSCGDEIVVPTIPLSDLVPIDPLALL